MSPCACVRPRARARARRVRGFRRPVNGQGGMVGAFFFEGGHQCGVRAARLGKFDAVAAARRAAVLAATVAI
eukprot:11173412-Lingulodinium_polyedra.AAC.1